MKKIFVFGSNLKGRHGAGAAEFAARFYQAEEGVGVGPTGNAYAIPTKDERLRPLSLFQINKYLQDFLIYADWNDDCIFILTPIGCGYAGHNRSDILKLLKDKHIPDNVVFSKQWMPGHEFDIDILQ